MPRQAQGEILDLADRILGKGKHGVLLCVGGDHVAVVACEVSLGKVAGQRDAHRHVFELVLRALGHTHHVRLRFPVLVVAEPDRHVPL